MDDGTRTHDGRNHNPGLYQLSYVHHRCKSHGVIAVSSEPDRVADGAPGRARTCDPRLRRPVLYPAELRAHESSACRLKWSGRRDSNPRPSAPKADALPDCATPRQHSANQNRCVMTYRARDGE